MSHIPADLVESFRPRALTDNKYTVGTVAIVGGSGHYIHAPVIAGLGARAGGAGLVQLVVPNASRIAAGALVVEATFTKLTATCVPPKADVMVIGMGLGSGVSTEVIVSRMLSGSHGRFVLDADALTVLAKWYGDRGGYSHGEEQQLVLTPHEGEAARLLGEERSAIAADRLGAAREIASRYGATVVLKGSKTLTVSADGGNCRINETGNPFMALGGMGDLLSGVIGARWAYLKGEAFAATASSVWLHSAAADQLVADNREVTVVNTASAIARMRQSFDTLR